jgi:hypothetical protein
LGRPPDANPAAFFVTDKKLFCYRDSRPAAVNSYEENGRKLPVTGFPLTTDLSSRFISLP